jgi:hypothetical protein
MILQKTRAAIFKHLNLIKNDDFDDAAIEKHLETHVKDSDWLKVAKDGYKNCKKELKPFYAEYQKGSNFTKEQCDVKSTVMVECIDINLFLVNLEDF